MQLMQPGRPAPCCGAIQNGFDDNCNFWITCRCSRQGKNSCVEWCASQTGFLFEATMSAPNDQRAFPKLTDDEMQFLTTVGKVEDYEDKQVVFKAGDADIDFFVVQLGAVDVLNAADDNSLIVTHPAGAFIGDIDLLTRRPVIVTVVAHGPSRLLRVPGNKLRQ